MILASSWSSKFAVDQVKGRRAVAIPTRLLLPMALQDVARCCTCYQDLPQGLETPAVELDVRPSHDPHVPLLPVSKSLVTEDNGVEAALIMASVVALC